MKTQPAWGVLSLVFASLVLAWTAAATPASDLGHLATVVDRTTHRASSYDRTGGNNDNIMSFEPGRTHVLLDTGGPGLITHMWLTVSSFEGHSHALRDLVIRIYWEGSKVPSVEVPLGDFFGLGHGESYAVRSLPINVGADPRALNCYWPMPFYKHARIELTSNGPRSIRRIYYNIDYELGPIGPKQALFHAEFRRVRNLRPQVLVGNTTGKDNYVILDVQGEGQYVGCFLFVDSAPGGWWGEGDEMIFIDGEKRPSIVGTGTEDYFCEAWGFDRVTGFPFYGIPRLKKLPDGWTQTTAYRFHVPDPVRFKKSIRVTIEHGWKKNVANDYSSVAYWYQLAPLTKRRPLPTGDDYRPRSHRATMPKRPSAWRFSATRAEPALRAAGVAARAITTSHRETPGGGYLRIDTTGRAVVIPLSIPVPGVYRVRAKFRDLGESAPLVVGLKGDRPETVEQLGAKGTTIELGTTEVSGDRTLTITARGSAPFGIDWIMVDPLKKVE